MIADQIAADGSASASCSLTLLASLQPMSGFRKVPPERWARSCGMTSVGESVSVQPQIEPLPFFDRRFPFSSLRCYDSQPPPGQRPLPHMFPRGSYRVDATEKRGH